MEEKVWKAIQKYALIKEGDNVIVALSGGADSVALFHFLSSNRNRLGITLRAAHLEHGLRGEQSRQDAAYVAELCQKYDVELFCEHAEMTSRPRPQGLGIEEWARRLRYDFFERLAERYSAKVATAHTLSDNAETVLFNAVRGTGPRGLGGIPPVRGIYIRPLLLATRAETEGYCTANSLSWVTDSTNADPSYSRNRLRLCVMPQLEKVHPGAQNSLTRTAEDMRQLDDWLEQQARALLDMALKTNVERTVPRGGYDVETLLAAPGPLCLRALGLLATSPNTDRAGLERAMRVLRGECRAAQLPDNFYAAKVKNRFYLEKKPQEPPKGTEIPLKEGLYTLWGMYKLEICTRKISTGEGNIGISLKSSPKGLTFLADCDKIVQCGVLRPRREGDLFSLPGRGVTKTIKKWMNECGIPPQWRGSLPLLANGNRVLWMWDIGFCEGVAPDEKTTKLLVIRQVDEGGAPSYDG